MGSGWLAKKLDAKMLEGKIADEWVPIDQLPIRPGREVAEELGGRLLLRYLIDAHDIGVPIPTFVSPTPYSVEEVGYSLALPRPDLARRYVLFLDPRRIDYLQGPRWCNLGSGIEYVLPNGFERGAVLDPGWGVEVR